MKMELERPTEGIVYFFIGLLMYLPLGIIGFIIGGVMIFILGWNNEFLSSDWSLFVVAELTFLLGAIIAAKGYRKIDLGNVFLLNLLLFVPFVGQLFYTYYLGKGTYMIFTKQEYINVVSVER